MTLEGAVQMEVEDSRDGAGRAGLYTSQGQASFRNARTAGSPAVLERPWRDAVPIRRRRIVVSGESAGAM